MAARIGEKAWPLMVQNAHQAGENKELILVPQNTRPDDYFPQSVRVKKGPDPSWNAPEIDTRCGSINSFADPIETA
jgi:hypothetical protein